MNGMYYGCQSADEFFDLTEARLDQKPVSSMPGWTILVCDATCNKVRLLFWLAGSIELI